jgi:hypothetical protein
LIDLGKVKKLEKISHSKEHEKERVALKKNCINLPKLH